MKKKIAILILIIGIVSLVAGITVFISNKNEENKKLENLKTSIVNDYEIFKSKVESFSDERTIIYQDLNSISYLIDVRTNYENFINEFTKYEETLNEIEASSKTLKVNCLENTFTDTNINNKVEAFIITYEQAINYFIQDVEKFNQRIREYNDWIENSLETTTYTKLEEYNSEYKEYVDINNDGIFNGVENK